MPSDEITPQLFTQKPQTDGGVARGAWIVAGVVVLLVVGALLVLGRHRGPSGTNTLQDADAYAANMPISALAMSESTSLSGGKSTFVDGRVGNTGGRTVYGATVQVIFRNDVGLQPQVFTTPLTVISMREPYIDTRTLAGAPLKPGDSQDFRLTFEQVAANWNQQMPEVRIVHVDSK